MKSLWRGFKPGWRVAYGIAMLVCVALGACLLWQAPVTLPVQAVTALPVLVRQPVQMQSALDQPLFTPARAPGPAKHAAAEQPIDAEVPRLIGIVVDDGQPAALLERSSGSERKLLRLGQTVGGWKLAGISRKSATLASAGARIEIPLSYAAQGGVQSINEGPRSP